MFLCIASEDTLGYYTARFTLGSRMLDRDKTEVAGRYSFWCAGSNRAAEKVSPVYITHRGSVGWDQDSLYQVPPSINHGRRGTMFSLSWNYSTYLGEIYLIVPKYFVEVSFRNLQFLITVSYSYVIRSMALLKNTPICNIFWSSTHAEWVMGRQWDWTALQNATYFKNFDRSGFTSLIMVLE